MEDRYTNFDACYNRLYKEYNQYGSLFIAFDFDNTVFDFHQVGDTYPIVENVLKTCKQKGFKLILFTANEKEKLEYAVAYCTQRGYQPDFINENPIMNTRKPYYNLLLDDRAGLGESVRLLTKLLDSIEL